MEVQSGIPSTLRVPFCNVLLPFIFVVVIKEVQSHELLPLLLRIFYL